MTCVREAVKFFFKKKKKEKMVCVAESWREWHIGLSREAQM
jgi:hypothetical protein